MSPRVSIGLPVYNGERYLSAAVDSILAQTYTDFELVISDNGSTDSTQELCRRYAAQDERVKYHRSEENRGGTWNFNRVVELSHGEFFRWAAHDDAIAPTYLERCVAVLDADPDVVLAHTQVEIIDGDDVSSGVYDAPPMRLEDDRVHVRFHDVTTYHGRLHLIFGVVRRDALDRIPAYGAYGHADGVLLARLIMLGKFVQLDEPLQLMREHADQASTTYGVKGGLDYLAWRAWFDPKYADALGFPYWRIVGEYARSLVVVRGVPLIERVRCLGGVWAAAWTTKGRMKQDLIRARGIVADRVRNRRKSATPEHDE
jgi:glycosyltransferase involved in cell wall biosynthesis